MSVASTDVSVEGICEHYRFSEFSLICFLSSAFSFSSLLLKPLWCCGSTDVLVCFAFVPAAQAGP